MEWFLIIAGIAFVGYILFAARFKRWLFGAEVIGAVKPTGDIARELKRLQIPVPTLTQAAVTLKGTRVLSDVVIPPVALDTIVAGLDELFIWYRSAYPVWSKAFTHGEYSVIFVEPMATNQDASPAIKVQGQQSAGTCIGFPFPMAYIVLPHQAKHGWVFKDYLFHSVFNEGEHFIQSHNSREVFNSHTGFNDVHRHVPAPAIAVGFKSKPQGTADVPVFCGLENYEA